MIYALIATGGVGEQALALTKYGKPIILLAHEELNSLPAAMEVYPLIKKSVPYSEIIYRLTPGMVKRIEKLSSIAKRVWKFKKSKILLIGGISPWLIYSRVDNKQVLEKFGIKINEIGIEKVIDKFTKIEIDREYIKKESEKLSSGVTESDLKKAVRLYSALKALSKKYDGMAVNCYDLISKFATTACLAIAKLINEGYIAGCEGDIPSTLTMMLAKTFTGQSGAMFNILSIRKGELILCHCTAPEFLLQDYVYETHFESGVGLSISGVVKEGMEVTIAKLSPDLENLYVGVGEIIKGRSRIEHACRTRFSIKPYGNLGKLLKRPLGAHLVIIPGNHLETFELAAKFLNLNVIYI